MANKLLISSSLIKDNVMLLAAHCFEYNASWNFEVGELRVSHFAHVMVPISVFVSNVTLVPDLNARV